MHARLLDVLHDAADHDVLAVAERVDVDLDRVVEKAVEEHRRIVRHLDRLAHVALEVAAVVDDLHRAPAEHVRRPHDERIADLVGGADRRGFGARGAVRRLAELQTVQHLLEALAVLRHVDHVGRRADDGNAVLREIARELQRRLAAVLDDDAERLLDVDDLEHVLQRERLEVQAIGRVVVGRHRLRIAVDHDRLVAVLAQRHRGVHAAVVELDPLPDPVGAAAQHDHLLPVGRRGFAFLFIGRIQVGGLRRKLGGAGVDALVDRAQPELMPPRPHGALVDLEEVRDPPVGEAHALQRAQVVARQLGERALFQPQLDVDDLLDLREEPGIDLRVPVDLLDRHSDAERIGDVPQPLGARIRELVADLVRIDRLEIEAVDARLEAAQRLLQRLLERAPDRHHLADGLHLRGEPVVGLLEFLEGEPGHLGDDIVDRRLERSRHGLSILADRDVVRQLVERVADRELGRDLGDREAGGLRRQRRAARHARIHLDDDHAAVGGIDRELHVRAAGVHAYFAQHGDRRVAHDLVFLVGQSLRRRDGDRVARVHAHRVEVLDRADDDAVVLAVAHDLHLELFPARGATPRSGARAWATARGRACTSRRIRPCCTRCRRRCRPA